jgi:protein YIPF6
MANLEAETTPLTAASQFIQAGERATSVSYLAYTAADDDEDLDEENIPGFSHPGLASPLPPPDKGKGRAREPDVLAPPSSSQNGRLSPALSGNIGSAVPGSSSGRGTRSTVGGIQVEQRYVPGQFRISISHIL